MIHLTQVRIFSLLTMLLGGVALAQTPSSATASKLRAGAK
jgi:hypothetical protein